MISALPLERYSLTASGSHGVLAAERRQPAVGRRSDSLPLGERPHRASSRPLALQLIPPTRNTAKPMDNPAANISRSYWTNYSMTQRSHGPCCGTISVEGLEAAH